ncbi:phosphatidylinositol 4,5-bisphosphate 3-kinase catalytic subunit gamma isoform [Lepisosteus oculatus]|uniref:phosphatidylinositol 4,5-bisphosphate 3-kinase catalytic subunit gamma isoform n=1 Tax=Lepisosteus oculatus TaxID=7918 RepID=UPI0037171CFF
MQRTLDLADENGSAFEAVSPQASVPDNILTFACVLPTKRGINVSNEVLIVQLPAQENVRQLRLHICVQAQEKGHHPDICHVLDPECYQLLYTRGPDWCEIYDDYQILRTLEAVRYWHQQGIKMGKIFVKPTSEGKEQGKTFHSNLAYLIGHDLNKTVVDRLDELSFARRKFASPRKIELCNRNPREYVTEPWTASVPLPKDQQTMLNSRIPITFHYNGVSLSVKADLKERPSALIEMFMQKMSDRGSAMEYAASDLTLKVCGREEFLTGEWALADFLWVRQCLKTKEGIHLSVLPVLSFQEDEVRIEDWPLVDSVTGLFNSHRDLTLANKEVDDILMISLWDCNRNFRVKLLGFDIPQFPSKAPQYVYVEAFILHGKNVVSSVRSVPKAFEDEVLWNVWLEFDMLLKNLPRGSKLGFSINGIYIDGNSTKENKSPPAGGKLSDYPKGKEKALYFVNLLLIDHRCLLRQGQHTLHMWPFPEQEEEMFTFEADKLSSTTNPDLVNSMAITIILDKYSFPVVLPHSRDSPPSSSSSVSSSLTKDDVSSKPSAVSHKGILQRFREESSQYGSHLLQFLSTINWCDPDTVRDIHWLLNNWDPHDLDISVALELLSIKYADEEVRRMAIKKLERLTNNELLRYLLQLVQTLKVEPYHDSFLARFLIQRALRSKRVGHYFFWYMRSEVTGSLYFRDRFAVILEAYLMGCGQAMLDGFLKQAQMVDCLHKVATDIKKVFSEKSDLPPNAALILQDMLRSHVLPQNFQVPYDPRIIAGQIVIQLEKCKVMASKKKPLWLEFTCWTSEESPNHTVGIIFKHGDDLRQDMLVIQTLLIMDSIWQEKSLDLNLVPYGCISTGYNIGMIEIVRDATTIATIQRNKGGTTGAFKNDALLEWLKGKCEREETLYQAMERFVTSCAGYCVATYVLGIGDRHNDNIMITEQGNLFHIDFGHILGNTKRFLGVNRERVPFVLTPDFLYVMGRVNKKSSLYFMRFRDTCIRAYLELRSHSSLLVTLFSLMTVTGIPELCCSEDIRYLTEALQVGRNEESARDHFLQQINICEQLGWTVQANWWIHLLVGIKQA